MQMRALLVGVLCLATLSAGCLHEPTVSAAKVFILDYTIVDLDPDEEPEMAEAGHHCGDVRKRGNVLRIELWPNEDADRSPWLAIFPSLPAGWHSGFGAAPFKTTFPATVDPRVGGDETPISRITWEPQGENGTMRVDGQAVSLPHTWSFTADDGRWRADLSLDAWRGQVEEQRLEGYCD